MTASAKRSSFAAGNLAKDLRTLPNLLSLSRLVLVFAGAALLVCGYPITGVVLGALAGVSDYLDGYMARRMGCTTELGAILDRLCDLVLESTSLVVGIHFGVVSPLFLVAYLFREFVVMSARMHCLERGVVLASTFIGKLKSNFLGYSFILLYLGLANVVPGAQRYCYGLAMFGLSAGLFFSYWSGFQYLRSFVRAYESER